MPLSTLTMRRHVVAGLAAGQAAAEVEVVDVCRGRGAGILSSAVLTMSAVRSSGRRSFSEPLLARPMGERAAETMTASGMEAPIWDGGDGARHPSRWSGTQPRWRRRPGSATRWRNADALRGATSAARRAARRRARPRGSRPRSRRAACRRSPGCRSTDVDELGRARGRAAAAQLVVAGGLEGELEPGHAAGRARRASARKVRGQLGRPRRGRRGSRPARAASASTSAASWPTTYSARASCSAFGCGGTPSWCPRAGRPPGRRRGG